MDVGCVPLGLLLVGVSATCVIASQIYVDDFDTDESNMAAGTDRLNDIDIRVAVLERKLATLTTECGQPPAKDGALVVHTSTQLNGVARYTCREGTTRTGPGRETDVSLCTKSGLWTRLDLKCCNVSNTETKWHSRGVYLGTVATSVTGKTCQRWKAQVPHEHRFKGPILRSPSGFASETLDEAVNYCRDPSDAGFMWCYTMDPRSRWEKCDVPKC
ncbi:hepatocyte growth factor-like protein [Haliotis cracherodii]|uniref:hepatocyte growth factor-like protein n=1 Tax=Haliotis cracherodii TaxID=6455 RepID=UPI0039ECD4EF